MYSFTYKKRVRYSETDKMGYLYYGKYASLYEIGRVETIRSLGVSYQEMEDRLGIMLPVLSLESRFLKPAYYDEELSIISILKEKPNKMICFDHQIKNQNGDLINTGIVKLFFIDVKSNKRVSCPAFINKALSKYFE